MGAATADSVTHLALHVPSTGNGTLDATELQDLAYVLGMVWSDEQTAQVLATIDTDGSGTVDLVQ